MRVRQAANSARIFFSALASTWRMRSALTPYSSASSCSVAFGSPRKRRFRMSRERASRPDRPSRSSSSWSSSWLSRSYAAAGSSAPSPVAYLRDAGEDPAAAYERESHEDDQLELLREGLSGLDARSRDILKRRFLGEPKATLQELADEYGVSAERIRQVEANALKKMKALFAA